MTLADWWHFRWLACSLPEFNSPLFFFLLTPEQDYMQARARTHTHMSGIEKAQSQMGHRGPGQAGRLEEIIISIHFTPSFPLGNVLMLSSLRSSHCMIFMAFLSWAIVRNSPH